MITEKKITRKENSDVENVDTSGKTNISLSKLKDFIRKNDFVFSGVYYTINKDKSTKKDISLAKFIEVRSVKLQQLLLIFVPSKYVINLVNQDFLFFKENNVTANIIEPLKDTPEYIKNYLEYIKFETDVALISSSLITIFSSQLALPNKNKYITYNFINSDTENIKRDFNPSEQIIRDVEEMIEQFDPIILTQEKEEELKKSKIYYPSKKNANLLFEKDINKEQREKKLISFSDGGSTHDNKEHKLRSSKTENLKNGNSGTIISNGVHIEKKLSSSINNYITNSTIKDKDIAFGMFYCSVTLNYFFNNIKKVEDNIIIFASTLEGLINAYRIEKRKEIDNLLNVLTQSAYLKLNDLIDQENNLIEEAKIMTNLLTSEESLKHYLKELNKQRTSYTVENLYVTLQNTLNEKNCDISIVRDKIEFIFNELIFGLKEINKQLDFLGN